MEPTVELLQGDLEPFVVIQYADHQRRMTVQQAQAFVEDAELTPCRGSDCLSCKVEALIAGIR